jgi:transcriptional regulator with XRE-family HTH domain
MADTDTVEGKVLRVVEARRKDANLTQTTLAELTGIPLATLNRYLRGHGSLPFRHLASIADALGTTPSAITAEAEAA